MGNLHERNFEEKRTGDEQLLEGQAEGVNWRKKRSLI